MPQGHTCVKLVGPREDWSLEWCWRMGQMSCREPDVLEGFRTTTPAKINTLPLPRLAVGMWTLDLHLHWTEQDTVLEKLFGLHQTWGLDRRNPGYKEKSAFIQRLYNCRWAYAAQTLVISSVGFWWFLFNWDTFHVHLSVHLSLFLSVIFHPFLMFSFALEQQNANALPSVTLSVGSEK